jgi:uncharacterized coiled-coil protein SlyX
MHNHFKTLEFDTASKISELERCLRSEYISLGTKLSEQSEELDGILSDSIGCKQEQADLAGRDINKRIDKLELESAEQAAAIESKLCTSAQSMVEQVDQIKERLKVLEVSLQIGEANLRRISNSVSYRIGHIVTWLPRKILNGIKRLWGNER